MSNPETFDAVLRHDLDHLAEVAKEHTDAHMARAIAGEPVVIGERIDRVRAARDVAEGIYEILDTFDASEPATIQARAAKELAEAAITQLRTILYRDISVGFCEACSDTGRIPTMVGSTITRKPCECVAGAR